MDKTRVNIYIDKNLWKMFKHKAVDDEKSMSSIVEDLIKEYLELEEEI
ncbi:MAG: ribbon-helix-helix protein, CopG family [Clostridium sp.]